jgi:hypothetical protein
MIPSPAVQHRVKHFDLLLARELVLLERIHEQNLLAQEKLEKSIRRDNQLLNSTRKKTSIISNGPFEHHKMPLLTNKNSDDKSCLSASSITNNQDQIEETFTPRYRRTCFKAHRLPPIVKANVSNRKKRPSKDLHWVASFQQDENVSDTVTTIIEEDLPKIPLPKLTPMQKEIHSFLESLPMYKGAHRGFDNFAPSSLYSTRAPVAMR